MPKYVLLCNYTDRGAGAIGDSAARHDRQQREFLRIGVRTEALYLTLGEYDLVQIMEAPDDETMAEMVMTINSWGWLRTKTMPAFDVEGYRRLVGKMADGGSGD